ncbi:MAG: uroporphyrinogen-III synthase [bacterium]
MTDPGPDPLAGKGVAVTRAEGESGPLGRKLLALGARVYHWQAVDIAPPSDPGPLRDALCRLTTFDWAVFTSPRAAAAVTGRVEHPPTGLKVAAVGIKTADALTSEGWEVHLVPKPFSGEALVEAFEETGRAEGARVFLPTSSIALSTVPEGLRALGAEVEQVTAYETRPAALDAGRVTRETEAGRVDALTWTSPSAVEAFREALGEEAWQRAAAGTLSAAIGPTTGNAVRGAGVPEGKIVIAEPSTLDGLAEAVADALDQE